MKIASIILLFLAMGCLFSCEKTDFNYPPGMVGSSKITYFATFDMAGSPYMSVVQGGTFTDPGVTATQNGSPLQVTVSGSVDVSQVGIYTITYSAINSDGFPASTTRTVAVLPSEEQAGVDISGQYFYVNTGGNVSTVTKVAPGFYSTTNCWSNATTIPILFICVDGANIIIPNQSTPYGDLSGSGTLSPDGALTYVISIPAQGITNSTRKWQLQ